MARRFRRAGGGQSRRRIGLIPGLARALGALARAAWRSRQLVAAGLVLASALTGMWAFAARTELFRVTEVQVVPAGAVQVSDTLIGRNIWDVNLQALAGELKAKHPRLKDVRVIRRLPNVLRIEAVERLPVAQLQLRRASAWYPVDRDGFIIAQPTEQPRQRLTRFLGVHQDSPAPSAGKRHAGERLALAMRVMAAVRRARELPPGRVQGIDVSQPEQLRLVLDDETEVRCGDETRLAEQLARLRGVLNALQRRRQLAMRYIDVRFDQPVVAPQPS
ncbi:MAG: FtsQ-type POTRA domain-containing protein [Candidatus Omnitrophica bacterium]|nr:FtsQ-type POTRA domain-containing protein [Candidatus Omnitrophota bacterium]